ncbi:MAG: hypothetical protein Q9227_006737 [Pyrenula ochraceoflavens]
MAETAPSFGAELKDGFRPVDNWVSNGIQWLDEIQQFYRERAAIEKEYSAKLIGLARKYHDKKAKKSSNLSVGDTPALTPGSLESASVTTWTTQLSTLEMRAADHDKLAQDLTNQVAAPLGYVAGKYEEIRKSHAEYAGKLQKERDSSYGDLKKAKSRYDGVCQEVENRRKKTETSFDSSKQKAQGAYQQQLGDMRIVKNQYLISINTTNKMKERYYHEYVPELLDSLQDLSETRVARLNSLWILAAQLENGMLAKGVQQMQHLSNEIPRNEPSLDSNMFIRHNVTQWQEPFDMVFEPSPVWLDSDEMATDPNSKTFLRNLLVKSKQDARSLKGEVDSKRREIEGLKRMRRNIRDGKEKRDEAELVRGTFALQEEMHALERRRLAAEVESSTITSAVGDLSLGAKNHNFKSETYKVPTNCDLCGERIWGLNAKGFNCRDCGYTCHTKCELKVPAECPGELSKEEKKKVKTERQAAANVTPVYENPTVNGSSDRTSLSRQDTMNSLSSGYAASAHRSVSGLSRPAEESIPESNSPSTPAPAPKSTTIRKNRIVAPPPAAYVSSSGPTSDAGSKSSEPRGKMLYPYQENGEGEVSVDEGRDIIIVEPDDGSGWMKVRTTAGAEGLVPASYVEVLPSLTAAASTSERPTSTYSSSSASLAGSTTAPKKKGPAVAPKRGAKKLQHVEAMYDYTAQSDAEWSMSEGDRFVLVTRDQGDGWAEVEKNGQTRSVPANYVQDV